MNKILYVFIGILLGVIAMMIIKGNHNRYTLIMKEGELGTFDTSKGIIHIMNSQEQKPEVIEIDFVNGKRTVKTIQK
ncbi:hypothetical protein BAX94_01015 [Elizabethkingia meningoseptica]|uniref:Uncharacterized protein n=1 Tax=Elizabethkingia meningoseptica TaxID=238 RepID=A0A1T3IK45_ELIME|nr:MULTISPECIES: hypothetical protein [Elizabethkingia]AQX12759.1 hypothetical protein BBD35_10420 [Elizabethkingia meningoseptica]MBG0514274.1 hypothetical protein [Elizabethkingia meningoseptica]MDE5430772.1 hypothetical protein [Elizabethkingia meningoseptica]MDE5433190.1 hypothetical protein [Elizabethkingia meningoseptica]MDE5447499.1 hypothetical protein [Elizabethkingia meningoseptica]